MARGRGTQRAGHRIQEGAHGSSLRIFPCQRGDAKLALGAARGPVASQSANEIHPLGLSIPPDRVRARPGTDLHGGRRGSPIRAADGQGDAEL